MALKKGVAFKRGIGPTGSNNADRQSDTNSRKIYYVHVAPVTSGGRGTSILCKYVAPTPTHAFKKGTLLKKRMAFASGGFLKKSAIHFKWGWFFLGGRDGFKKRGGF